MVFNATINNISAILCQFYLWRKPEYPEKTTDRSQVTNITYCWVHLAIWRIQTHNISGVLVAQWVRSLDLTAHTSLSPIRRGFAPSFVNYKKGCTRLAAASDKVYQLLAQGRWFSPGTPASWTTKTGRHEIAEILLKVALNTKNKIKSITTLVAIGTDCTGSCKSNYHTVVFFM